jgi:hypothetical protein
MNQVKMNCTKDITYPKIADIRERIGITGIMDIHNYVGQVCFL